MTKKLFKLAGVVLTPILIWFGAFLILKKGVFFFEETPIFGVLKYFSGLAILPTMLRSFYPFGGDFLYKTKILSIWIIRIFLPPLFFVILKYNIQGKAVSSIENFISAPGVEGILLLALLPIVLFSGDVAGLFYSPLSTNENKVKNEISKLVRWITLLVFSLVGLNYDPSYICFVIVIIANEELYKELLS